jgi:hypothetical protein
MNDFNYDISVKDNHILVTTNGICTSVEQILAYGNDIFSACQKEKLYMVLIDDRKVIYSTSFWENYNIAKEATSMRLKRSYIKIAQVANQSNLEISSKMETVFRNRGLDMKVFDSIDKAQEWLLNNI